MKISELDLLHHRMILGDLQAKEQLKNAIEAGVKKKCPIVQDFLNRAKQEHDKNKPLVLKPSFIQRHADKIIRYTEKPYQLTKWFLIASTITAFIVEAFYA
jgi:hypothetical protein